MDDTTLLNELAQIKRNLELLNNRVEFMESSVDIVHDKMVKLHDIHHNRLDNIDRAIQLGAWIIAIELLLAAVIYLS